MFQTIWTRTKLFCNACFSVESLGWAISQLKDIHLMKDNNKNTDDLKISSVNLLRAHPVQLTVLIL